jgi:hypothetical protein
MRGAVPVATREAGSGRVRAPLLSGGASGGTP